VPRSRAQTATAAKQKKGMADFTDPGQVPEVVEECLAWGTFYQLADNDSVLAVMVGAPLPPGLEIGRDAAASAANLRTW
jgi:hypothetical protein